MGRDSLKLGPLEMEIVGLLEGNQSFSVHDIQAKLGTSGKKLAYTTVMTILSRLYEKGLLKREKNGRQFLYSHATKVDKVRRGVWDTVYQSLFRNDRLKPILNLISQSDNLSTEELQQLKQFVDAKIKDMGGSK
jgi:predicted transcriptional regulator